MLNVDTPSVVLPSARKGTFILGYDRSRGGLTANARQKVCAASVGCVKEAGYIDVAAADYVLDTTGSVTLLNTVAQARGCHPARGKKIVMKGLQCRGNLQNGSTADPNDVAFMIVYDKRRLVLSRPFPDILVSAS